MPDPGRPSGIFTAITMLNNDLTTFEGGYTPGNYHNDKRTLGISPPALRCRFSQNNATVSLAQMVGYNNVAALGAGCRNQICPRNAVSRYRAPTMPLP